MIDALVGLFGRRTEQQPGERERAFEPARLLDTLSWLVDSSQLYGQAPKVRDLLYGVKVQERKRRLPEITVGRQLSLQEQPNLASVLAVLFSFMESTQADVQRFGPGGYLDGATDLRPAQYKQSLRYRDCWSMLHLSRTIVYALAPADQKRMFAAVTESTVPSSPTTSSLEAFDTLLLSTADTIGVDLLTTPRTTEQLQSKFTES